MTNERKYNVVDIASLRDALDDAVVRRKLVNGNDEVLEPIRMPGVEGVRGYTSRPEETVYISIPTNVDLFSDLIAQMRSFGWKALVPYSDPIREGLGIVFVQWYGLPKEKDGDLRYYADVTYTSVAVVLGLGALRGASPDGSNMGVREWLIGEIVEMALETITELSEGLGVRFSAEYAVEGKEAVRIRKIVSHSLERNVSPWTP